MIVDKYIKDFSDYSNLKSYAQAVEEIELLGICKVVENYRYRLPALVDAITRKTADPENAQVILTTAHKSKGLQWPNVYLTSDYLSLIENGELIDPTDIDPDEFNLIYVAITRTIYNLRFKQGKRFARIHPVHP